MIKTVSSLNLCSVPISEPDMSCKDDKKKRLVSQTQ